MLSQANVIILFHSKCQAIWDKEGSFSLTSLFLFGNFRRDSSAYAGDPALDVEECVNAQDFIAAINLLCFGGFRSPADDPPKPWRRWVGVWETTPACRNACLREAPPPEALRRVGAPGKAGTSACRRGLVRGAPSARRQR